jgi:hypothetical protein
MRGRQVIARIPTRGAMGSERTPTGERTHFDVLSGCTPSTVTTATSRSLRLYVGRLPQDC